MQVLLSESISIESVSFKDLALFELIVDPLHLAYGLKLEILVC